MGGSDPCMLIEVPHGPDHDHVTYNMLNLSRGYALYMHGYPTIRELMRVKGLCFTKLDGYVCISREK